MVDNAIINSAMTDFSETSNLAKDHATALLNMISSGHVPTKQQLQGFGADVELLQKHYDIILESAKQILNVDEMPSDPSASELVSAIESKQKKVLEKKVLSACLLLQRFTAVKSYLETYTLALEPYQKRAESMLMEIDNGNLEAIADASVIESIRAFLNAMELESYESKEGLAALEALDQYFPIKIQLGIARKQYYFDESVQKVTESTDSEDRSLVLLPEEPAESNEQSHGLNITDIDSASTEIGDDEGQSSWDVKDDNTEKHDDPSAITDNNVSSENELGLSDDTGDEASLEKTTASTASPDSNIVDSEAEAKLTSINKIKKATPSASGFKKELSKLPKEAFALLPLFTNLGALSDKQAFRFGVAMGCFVDDEISLVSVKNCLSTLCNKSLLSSFDLDKDIVYCLTTYGNGCLRKETIQQNKRFQISFGKYSFVADSSIEKSVLKKAIDYNELLLRYFYGIKESLSKDDYQIVKGSLTMKNGYYNVAVLFNGEKHICTLHNNLTDYIEAENLLIVSECVPDGFSELYQIVFLYKEGTLYRIPEIESNTEQKNAESLEGQEDTVLSVQEESPTSVEDTKASSSDSDHSAPAIKVPDKNISNQEKEYSAIPSLEEMINATTILDDTTFAACIAALSSGKMASVGVISDIVRATILARSASFYKGYDKCSRLANKLLLATHLPLANYQYTSEAISDALSDCGNEYIKLAIYIQALLTPASSYDYLLYSMAEGAFKDFDTDFSHSRYAKPLFNKLLSVHEVLPMGFSASVMSLLGSATEQKQYAEMLQSKARDALTLPRIKTQIKDLPMLYTKCFGSGSEIYDCIKIIAENKVEEVDWVREVLTQYCDGKNEELVISEENIATVLDATWDEVNSKSRFVLEYGARDKILREFDLRLLLMKSWIEYVNQSYDSRLDIKRINVLRKEIISLVEDASRKAEMGETPFAGLLKYVFWFVKCYLTDPENIVEAFKEFFYTGVFTLTDEGIPVIDASMVNIKYYEPWRRLLKHIASPIRTKEQAREAIVEQVGSELFDNLHQLSLLNAMEGENGGSLSESQVRDAKKAKNAAEDRTKKFKENLELAYTYNRISEPEKEKLATIMEEYKPKFFEMMDFGCWSQFLDALEKEINELAAEKKNALRKELDARKQTLKEGETSTILDEAEMLLEKAMNFAVTEEYFNRFDNGEREFSDDLYATLHEEDSFTTFLSDGVFRPLQQECENHSGRALKSFAWTYLEPRVPKNWTVRQKDDSRRLVENWPYRKGATTANNIIALFTCLGFAVKTAEKGRGKKEEFYKLEVEATARSMADYRHPISMFGTQMKSPLNVVVLYGNYAPKQLVDTITGLDFGGMAIVLIDRPINRASRRQIGEIFHTQTSGQNPFLLIDQILILHLAMYQVTERLPVMLKCSLPYTTYQPFVRDGGSTADEMFCGRSRELATILDPNGASVVYGGRQLGKTALLQRAESRRSNPANKEYAIYCNIINCGSEEALVNKVTEDLARKAGITLAKCSTISDFCMQLDKMFRTNKIRSMLLLLDEADKFLSAIADEKYTQLQSLIDLKRETTNRFKFVLAGLHNVCRAKNATSENGVFGQLGTPLCVKPLSPTDALQLLSRPLKYLGFEIDRYPHLETILTNTNYYPGILQFFGYNLVEALTTQYGRYYGAADGNPPFTLQDDQLGAVMNDADLNRSIRDKFRWSLELDPRYFMIARCITLLYYLRDEDTENWLGFSVDEIMTVAKDYDIHCLETCGKNDYVNLLDEMVEMGILSKPSNGLYRLRRNSFVNIIGMDFDTLDADIINSNLEA